jgi:protease-4
MKVLKVIFMILLIILIADIIYIMSGQKKEALLTDSVVLVKLEGVLFDSQEFSKNMDKYKNNHHVKAFIIQINSPGGVIGPTQQIYRYIKELKVPVYAAMDSVAASGGYYVAAACKKIYTLPGTITGSIGVMLQLSNFKQLLDKVGINFITVKSGQFKDIGSPYREISEDEKAILQETINDLYGQFIDDIKDNRQIDNETISKYADGRIFTGSKAVQLGFADKIGTVEDAFNDLKKELKNSELKLYKHEKEKKVIEKLLSKLPFKIRSIMNDERFYYIYSL